VACASGGGGRTLQRDLFRVLDDNVALGRAASVYGVLLSDLGALSLVHLLICVALRLREYGFCPARKSDSACIHREETLKSYTPRGGSLVLLLAASLAAPAWGQSDKPEVNWRLENPFRLFRDARDFEKFRMLPRESVQDWFRRHAHAISGDYLPARRTWWDPEGGINRTGQYQPGYLHPASHRVVLEWKDQPADAICDWKVGKRPVRGPCRQVTVDVPYQPESSGKGEPVPVSVTSADGRTQATAIRVRDVLVLGMGDSFSAGEGAPDRPAQLTRLDSNIRKADGFEGNRWVWVPEVVRGEAARWWDDECHRSLLSWQALSALKLASDEADAAASGSRSEQMAVTFASYACSGAEIHDGVIHPQKNPPGPMKVDGSGAVQRSQLHAASLDLCDGTGTQIYTSGANRYYYQSCGIRRAPQVVLISIGGNDAGFAKVIMNTLVPGPELGNTPPGALALAVMKRALGTVEPAKARQRANAMGESLPVLSQKMQRILGVNPSDVVFMQYPNPLSRPARLRTNGSCSPHCGLEMRAGMEATRFLSPVLRNHWHMWGTQKEFDEVVGQMVKPLQQIIESKRGAWRLVTDHLADFAEHGLCADAEKAESDELAQTREGLEENIGVYGLPRQWPAADGQVPLLAHYFFEGAYNPSHQRWFRTPNDSVQVQAQTAYAKSMTGAFHPNGSGYARMGDAAYKTMSEVLRGANVAGQ
jgi:hypothetical protein